MANEALDCSDSSSDSESSAAAWYCLQCGYDLRAQTDDPIVCPECGFSLSATDMALRATVTERHIAAIESSALAAMQMGVAFCFVTLPVLSFFVDPVVFGVRVYYLIYYMNLAAPFAVPVFRAGPIVGLTLLLPIVVLWSLAVREWFVRVGSAVESWRALGLIHLTAPLLFVGLNLMGHVGATLGSVIDRAMCWVVLVVIYAVFSVWILARPPFLLGKRTLRRLAIRTAIEEKRAMKSSPLPPGEA